MTYVYVNPEWEPWGVYKFMLKTGTKIPTFLLFLKTSMSS